MVKPEDMEDYGHYRDIGVYCPFPEGVWSSIRARDAEGVGIINEIGYMGAAHRRALSVQATGKGCHRKGLHQEVRRWRRGRNANAFLQIHFEVSWRSGLRGPRLSRRSASVRDP